MGKLSVIRSDRFYLAVFAEIFRNIDFNQIEPSDNPEGQAQNIQALIDILERYVLDIDLDGVKGVEIVKGNQKQILELLLLIHEISDLVNRELDDEGGQEHLEEEAPPQYPQEYQEDDSYPDKQSAEKPEPKNFIFPDPGESAEGLDELRREVLDEEEEEEKGEETNGEKDGSLKWRGG